MTKREKSDRETRWLWAKRASPAGWWLLPPDHGNLAMSPSMLMEFFILLFPTVRKRRFGSPTIPRYGTELNDVDRGVMPADRVLCATIPKESVFMTKILPRAPWRKRPPCVQRPPTNQLLSSGTEGSAPDPQRHDWFYNPPHDCSSAPVFPPSPTRLRYI